MYRSSDNGSASKSVVDGIDANGFENVSCLYTLNGRVSFPSRPRSMGYCELVVDSGDDGMLGDAFAGMLCSF